MMAVDTMVLEKVMLIPDQLWILNKEEMTVYFNYSDYEDMDLTLFNMKSIDIVYKNTSRPETGIMLRIVLKRKVTIELMTTFLPTLCLLLLTFSGKFINVKLFGDAMAHHLIIMLAMTIFFTSKVKELPQTSYLKMSDIWLIFCQLVPLIEIIFYITILSLREATKKRNINIGKENEKGNKVKYDPNTDSKPECIANSVIPNQVTNQTIVTVEQQDIKVSSCQIHLARRSTLR